MSDFRDRLGAELGAAAARLSGAEADFRDRLAVQLTAAAAELGPDRARAPAAVARRDSELVADFRDRLAVELAAAAVTLAATSREAFGAERRARLEALPAQPYLGGDFRARLGAQLTASAGALAEARQGELATRRIRRRGTARAPAWRGARILPRLARPLAVALALTGLAGAATASSLWLAPVGNPHGGVNPGLSASPPPAAQLAALAVLRRPQTATDRAPGVRRELEDINDFTTGVRSNYVRVLATTGAGPVVLVPVAERRAVATAVRAASARDAIPDALCVYYPVAGAGGLGSSPDCWSTAQLLAGRAVSSADGHVFGLAPDGVGSVSLALAGAGGPLSASVTGNFFDALLPASSATAGPGGAPRPPASPVVTFRGGASTRAGRP